MRVLMISPQFRPMVGGYERAAERLCHSLTERGIKTTVVTFQLHRSWPDIETADGIEIRRLWCLPRRGMSTLTTVASLSAYLLRDGRRFAVWHCHAPTPAVAVACLWGRILGRPVVVKLPSSGVGGLEATATGGFIGRLRIQPYMLRLADAFLATTRTTFEEASRFAGTASKAHLIPNGLNIELFSPNPYEKRLERRAMLGIPQDRRVVLQVCNLRPEKNLVGLLKAWAKTPEELRARWTLVIVGEGIMRSELEELAEKLQLRDSTMLPGQANDVVSWYQAADVYVLSSFYEGLSNSLLEAMACGLPTVMTDVSGRELVSTVPAAGLVVPIDDSHRMASALAIMCNDDDLRRTCGQAARERIQEGFGLDHVTTRTIELYEKTIAFARARPRPQPHGMKSGPSADT